MHALIENDSFLEFLVTEELGREIRKQNNVVD